MNIPVDADHPLIVYIPAGIGGSPGGVSYGLRRIYGDDVHAFFVEPSSCAAFVGPLNLLRLPDAAAYCKAHDLTPARLANATQIAWATGGGFVPEEMWTEYLATYQ